ncbi:sulfite exporter TauE/SafE family protein [Desulfofundulus salinus]|uniref:Probable membrane transporter protein n=1 Tax=Desulfofundulus salinus TaxID=2419843 RepID=A0A494WSK7_9FIRM|nr:sulfite exporter TauE/SafE family protein [Desulfofundulus salinum]RKO66299.1 sulfite exporter TauE/SafE family protein [Desulfofundulus salinum]
MLDWLATFTGGGLAAKATAAVTTTGAAVSTAAGTPGMPWWVWPLLLFITTFVLGIVAVLGGVGGGVLFVPIVGSFFPFNLDFVRGAGLLVALAGALAAGPGLLKLNLANLRLALPVALIASTFSMVGAFIGLALPNNVVQTALGITIVLIAILFVVSKNTEFPQVGGSDKLARFLGIGGTYYERSSGKTVDWSVWRTPQGFLLFIAIGIMAGMFGLGAGWANVPVLNLLMGAPLKVAVGTSKFLLSITDTSAAWVYLNQGAVLPVIAVPSIVGIMLGSFVGVRLLATAKPRAVKYLVIVLLLAAGLRSLLKGLGIWN